MDSLTQDIQTVSASQQYPAFVALFAIVLIVMVVLVGVVLIQNRRIREMQKPKFGFLGKPLNAFVVLAVMLGGLGFVYYNTTTRTNEFTDVSADSSVELSIVITQVDRANRIYKLNAIPIVDNIEWGGEANNYSFDIRWTISNSDVYSRIEEDLSFNNRGGIELNLTKGEYTVSAITYFGPNNERNAIKETTLEVE